MTVPLWAAAVVFIYAAGWAVFRLPGPVFRAISLTPDPPPWWEPAAGFLVVTGAAVVWQVLFTGGVP